MSETVVDVFATKCATTNYVSVQAKVFNFISNNIAICIVKVC